MVSYLILSFSKEKQSTFSPELRLVLINMYIQLEFIQKQVNKDAKSSFSNQNIISYNSKLEVG